MIFFDIDDTLLDHKYSEYLGVMAFYNEYKHQILYKEESFYKSWCQISDKYFQKYLKGEMTFSEQQLQRIKEIFYLSGINISDEESAKKFNVYLNKYQENWRPFSDVIPCLKELAGYSLGIISNGDLEQQSLKLERLGIINHFQIIVTAGEIGTAKPNIKLFETACKRANENSKDCYYVGDNLDTDILPCREIGMHGIWLNRNGKQTDFKDITTIKTLKDLNNILL